MKAKLGRNEPCFCGSGKKYKKCHLGRDNQPKVNPWNIEAQLKKNFTQKECMRVEPVHGQCEGKIVSAHTVSIGAALKSIAENQCVMGYKLGFAQLNKANGKILPIKMGVRQASTFFGFCSKHDREIFSCLENADFEANAEQVGVLAFRTVSKELYLKRAQGAVPDLLRQTDQGKNLAVQFGVQNFANLFSFGGDLGLRDVTVTHSEIAELLSNNGLNELHSMVFEFNEVFPIMFSGAFAPMETLGGVSLQDLGKSSTVARHLIFSSLGRDEKSQVIMSWLPSANAVVGPFVDEICEIDDSALQSLFLFQVAMKQLENCFFRPSWYQGLNDGQKDAILSWVMSGVMPGLESKYDLGLEFPLPEVIGAKRPTA